jgi:hypothetical protein
LGFEEDGDKVGRPERRRRDMPKGDQVSTAVQQQFTLGLDGELGR